MHERYGGAPDCQETARSFAFGTRRCDELWALPTEETYDGSLKLHGIRVR